MTALFILAGLIWSGVLIYALPGAVGSFGKQPRQGDAMRLGVLAVSAMVIAGVLRWLVAPRSEALLTAQFVFVCGVGCLVAWLMRSYGRGNHVE